MPIIESAAIAIAVEAGSRGWEWVRDSSAEANAPLLAAQEVADETEVTTSELRTAFERASEGGSPKEFAYKSRETFVDTVAAELDTEDSADIVRLYLHRLEDRLVEQGDGEVIALAYLRQLSEDFAELQADIKHSRYYRVFSSEKADAAQEFLLTQTDHTQRLPFVPRPKVPDTLSQKHLLVGSKGSGKSRLLLESAMIRLNSDAVQSILIPSQAASRVEDIQAAFTRQYDGDVLLVWDDVHTAGQNGDTNLFYETVLKLNEQLDDDQSLHVLGTARSEELSQLPKYTHWNEDPVWEPFERTALSTLEKPTAEALIDHAVGAYDLEFTETARRQFEEFVNVGHPTPFYIDSACSHLAKEAGPEVTKGDILDLPSIGGEIWARQYRHLREADPDGRFVLLSLKLLRQVSGETTISAVRGVFANVFDREGIDFHAAVERLVSQQWVTVVGGQSMLQTHAIQLEAVSDPVELYFDKLAEYLLSDVAETDPERAIGLLINLGVKIFIDPSITDESLIQHTVERILTSKLIDRVSKEAKWTLHSNYAGMLAGQGDLTGAQYQTTQAIQTDPTAPIGYLNHQRIANQLNEPKISVESLRRAVELVSEDSLISPAEAHVELAKCLHRQGDDFEAKEEFEKAMAVSDESPYVCQHFAHFNEGLNQIGKARHLHEKAVEKTNSTRCLYNYVVFLERHGPQNKYDQIKKQILNSTPSEVESLDQFAELMEVPRLQWTPEGHNSPLITDSPQYQLREQAREIKSSDGPSDAAEWLERKLEENPRLPLIKEVGLLYIEASQPIDAFRIFNESLPEIAASNSAAEVSEFAIGAAYTLEDAGATEKADELCETAASLFDRTSESNRQARAMLMRHRAGLTAVDPMNSFMLPYILGKSHILHGDLENAINTFLDAWKRREKLPDEGTKENYGAMAGTFVLALFELLQTDGSELYGEALPIKDIDEFVTEHISATSEEVQQLYAEVQHQRGDEDPLISQCEIPAPGETSPEEVELEEDDLEAEDVIRSQIAICNTLRVWLQE